MRDWDNYLGRTLVYENEKSLVFLLFLFLVLIIYIFYIFIKKNWKLRGEMKSEKSRVKNSNLLKKTGN